MDIDLTMFPDVTDTEVGKMIHAVGLDDARPYNHRNGRYYTPYRNYYGAGPGDRPYWDHLVSKGFAVEQGSKGLDKVSLLGLNALSIITGIHIWSEAAKAKVDTKQAVLRALIDSVVCGRYGEWVPRTSGQLAANTRIPLKKVRDALRVLVAEGYAVKDYYGEGGDGDGPCCYHGYSLTKKGEELPYYKAAWKAECEYIDNMIREENYERPTKSTD